MNLLYFHLHFQYFLELTIDLPTMNGFIAQWLQNLP